MIKSQLKDIKISANILSGIVEEEKQLESREIYNMKRAKGIVNVVKAYERDLEKYNPIIRKKSTE